MTIHRIRSSYLRSKGERFESADRKSAERRLVEVKKHDPAAKIITLGAR